VVDDIGLVEYQLQSKPNLAYLYVDDVVPLSAAYFQSRPIRIRRASITWMNPSGDGTILETEARFVIPGVVTTSWWFHWDTVPDLKRQSWNYNLGCVNFPKESYLEFVGGTSTLFTGTLILLFDYLE